MAALLKRKVFVLAKKETTEGTDASPTGAANAVLTHGLALTPLAGDTVQRDVDREVLGNDLAIHVNTHVMVEFDVEVAGSGAAGTAPAYAELLMGCGFAETINASTSAVYDPVSSSFDSLTLHFHHDGQKHAMVGARGNVSMDLNAGEIPRFHFTFTGLWVDPASSADPTPDFSSYQVPLPVNNVNTPTFTLHATALNMVALSLDMANEVTHRDIVGTESVNIYDRAPAGSVTFESPTLTTKNWFTIAKANTTGALQLVHGTTAGNIVQIDAPAVQALSPTYGGDSVSEISMGLALIPSSGDDEISLTIK